MGEETRGAVEALHAALAPVLHEWVTTGSVDALRALAAVVDDPDVVACVQRAIAAAMDARAARERGGDDDAA
jgi:hypothetical protein